MTRGCRRLRGITIACLAVLGARTARAQTPGQTGNQIAVEYGYTHFSVELDPWHLASISYTRNTPAGALIGRANYAYRFGESGAQLEVDAYPKFGRGLYAYLNGGYAPSGSFPDWRIGGELYANLPTAWEASAGFRHLRFGEGTTIWTGSVGKYHGNYWHSLRPFLRSSQGDASWTVLLETRRYSSDADEYVGMLFAYGSTPGDVLTEIELERESDLKVEVTRRRFLTERLHWQWRASLEREDLTLAGVRYRVGVTVRFERAF